jgi:hypothetical protein
VYVENIFQGGVGKDNLPDVHPVFNVIVPHNKTPQVIYKAAFCRDHIVKEISKNFNKEKGEITSERWCQVIYLPFTGPLYRLSKRFGIWCQVNNATAEEKLQWLEAINRFTFLVLNDRQKEFREQLRRGEI